MYKLHNTIGIQYIYKHLTAMGEAVGLVSPTPDVAC